MLAQNLNKLLQLEIMSDSKAIHYERLDSFREILPSYITPVAKEQSITTFAPINIALVKYWGKCNQALNIANFSNISVSAEPFGTNTTLKINNEFNDRIWLNGKLILGVKEFETFQVRLLKYLKLFREATNSNYFFDVKTNNNVPTGAGLATSASGFAAIAKAINLLFGLKLGIKQLSILARLGSGSACRSVLSGFVEWNFGKTSLTSFASQIELPWQEIEIGIVQVDARQKLLGSSEGMIHTQKTSPIYDCWGKIVEAHIKELKKAIQIKNFTILGEISEQNALAMHATMLAAKPSLLYWQEATLTVIKKIWQLRKEGLEVYFTIDAGPNVKLLYQKKNRLNLLTKLEKSLPKICKLTLP